MTKGETSLFIMLDSYARYKHGCLLTELFVNRDNNGYFFCFRPIDRANEDPNRLNCVYLKTGIEEAKSMWSKRELSNTLVQEMGRQTS